MSQWLKGGAGR